MGLEIGRRLIDGIWRTGSVDESASPGGGSLPDEWTVDADGGLTIAVSDTDGIVNLHPASQVGTKIEQGVIDNGDGTGSATLSVGGTGGGSGTNISVSAGGGSGGSAFVDGRGQVQLFTASGVQAIQAWDVDGNVVRFALSVSGAPIVGVVAAPADGDLAASQVALWFDDTDGAAKLKIKGKSADGTVVTGTVNLA